MLSTNDFTVQTQGACTVHAFQEGFITGYIRGRFSTAKEIFAKNVSFMKLLRTFVANSTSYYYYPANEVKQKTKLATYGRRYRKGRGHFVSEMWSSTLRVAFLLINCKSK